MPYLIAYQRQHREHYWNMLTLDEQYVASGVCMFSRPGMPVRRLGQFRAELSAGHPLVAQVNHLVSEHHLNERALASVPPGPGRQFVWFKIRDGQRWTMNSHPALAPLPEPLEQLETAMLGLLAEAARQPLRSLALRTALNAHSFKPGQEFSVRLTLTNDGKFTTRFLNPASGAGSVSFFVWLAGQPEGDDQDTGYVTTLSTKGLEFLKGPREALPSDVEQLELGAGQSLVAAVHYQLPNFNPAAYQLQLVYNAMAGAGASHELILGGYHAEPSNFQVE